MHTHMGDQLQIRELKDGGPTFVGIVRLGGSIFSRISLTQKNFYQEMSYKWNACHSASQVDPRSGLCERLLKH